MHKDLHDKEAIWIAEGEGEWERSEKAAWGLQVSSEVKSREVGESEIGMNLSTSEWI